MKSQLQILLFLALTGSILYCTLPNQNQLEAQQEEVKKCPFAQGQAQKTNFKRKLDSLYSYPADILTCPTASPQITLSTFTKTNYEAAVYSVIALYEKIDATVAANNNPRSQFAGCLLRLAGHDFMDFRHNADGTTSGGSDGCINFNDGDNAGLMDCMITYNLQAAYQTQCSVISIADFIVIAAEAVMGRTATSYNPTSYFASGTLAATFRDNFQFGRVTAYTCLTDIGNMPNAGLGCSELERVFINQVYESVDTATAWELTAAISGAHTLGSAKINNSGYQGFWSTASDSGIFDNGYYKSLMLKGWAPQLAVNGNTNKNQWQRIDQGKTTDGNIEMMLDTDMCLLYKSNPVLASCLSQYASTSASSKQTSSTTFCAPYLKTGSALSSSSGNCCAWTDLNTLFNTGTFTKGSYNSYCGLNVTASVATSKENCCKNQPSIKTTYGNCDYITTPEGPAYTSILKFVKSESVWLASYELAWKLATENGFSTLKKPVSY